MHDKQMKHGVSNKAQVLELRRGHSLREVAAQTGLPLGTVKTICARSGAFKDNPQHRVLFTLPEVQSSTTLAAPMLPTESPVTGDKEIDAVLWLREVIKTGRADLIEKAMEAAKRIKTPLKDLEKRYTAHLIAKIGGSWVTALGSFGLPHTLLERFSGIDAQSQLVRCLQFLAPLSRPGVITHGDGR